MLLLCPGLFLSWNYALIVKSPDYFVITFVTPNRSLSPLSKKILIPLFFNEQYQAGSNTKFL